MFRTVASRITSEINAVLQDVDEENITSMLQAIVEARRIVVCGAGRVGLTCKGFAMRLGHLGVEAYTLGDSTIPPVGKGDLLIVGSSSGETQTIYDVTVLGKKNGAHVVLITAAPESRIAKCADALIVLKTPTKFGSKDDGTSIQPMATLFEQCLQILFDTVVLLLMEKTLQRQADLWERHTNLD